MYCHSYLFFDIEPNIHLVPENLLAAYKIAFLQMLAAEVDVSIATYATLGFRTNTRFLLHLHTEDVAMLQRFVQKLVHTDLGKHLRITYTLLGLIRPTQYNSKHAPEEKQFVDGSGKYLIVYPFTKTIEWHLLPFEERREMMKEHVMTARKFSGSISQLLLYSYGVDDHEFIVSYLTDSLDDFQSLVMELRATKGRLYTKNDLPIFLATYMSPDEALAMI